jgi:two-component system, OmpR family, response regulator
MDGAPAALLPQFRAQGCALMSEHEESENGEALSREALAAKRVLTTGEAAIVCGLSQQTIIRCFDSGRLSGFKVPGSKFRRIPREELVRFMRMNNLPMEIFQNGPVRRVLTVCAPPSLESACKEAFHSGYELAGFSDPFLAGANIGASPPDILILAVNEHNSEEALRRIAALRALTTTGAMRIIAVVHRQYSGAVIRAGADSAVADHADPRDLAAALLEAAAALFGTT